MKFIQPVLGAGETAAGVATMNPALIAGGVGTLGSGIAGALQKPPSIPSLSPTTPTSGPQPDLSSILGSSGGGGLTGSITPSVGSGGSGQGGSTFGSLGGNDLQGLLSMILQGVSGGTF